MKKILILMMLVSATSYSAVTFQQAKQVWRKIENKTGHKVQLIRDPSVEMNAASYGNRIVIAQGMLNALQNESQLEMVLAHEMAHNLKRHYLSFGNRINKELEADKLGYQICGRKECLQFFDRMRKVRGDEGSNTHPSWSNRRRALENA